MWHGCNLTGCNSILVLRPSLNRTPPHCLQVVPNAGVSVSNVDMTDLAAVKAAIIPGKTSLVMVESPTNPRMQVRALLDAT